MEIRKTDLKCSIYLKNIAENFTQKLKGQIDIVFQKE